MQLPHSENKHLSAFLDEKNVRKKNSLMFRVFSVDLKEKYAVSMQ